MKSPAMLTGSLPVWWASIWFTNVANPRTIVQRKAAEDGLSFAQLPDADDWCQAIMNDLIAIGVPMLDVNALIIRGRWTWPLGNSEDLTFLADDPEVFYYAYYDHDGIQWWLYHRDHLPRFSDEVSKS